jgi:hypothetical protein
MVSGRLEKEMIIGFPRGAYTEVYKKIFSNKTPTRITLNVEDSG